MYIYIHIPFCSSICSYCDFPKVLYNKKYIRKYLDTIKQEILSRYKDEEVFSLYIGGGTPTSLDYDELKYLLDICTIFKKAKNIEFTIESNVECLTVDKTKLLKEYNVNRVSLGVQSFNEVTLKELNRQHTKEDVFTVVSNLKSNGFENISIDYIYGVRADIGEVENDIKTFLKLDIPHISCYSLIIEKGTVFGINKRKYIDEDVEESMYKHIRDSLISNGYIHYEISNYAKEGYQSRHNLNYWDNGFYYGFGLGAVSYLNNNRITNTRNLTKYLNGDYVDGIECEDKNTDISNTFMLGFRKVFGINIVDFQKRYNKNVLDIEVVSRLIEEGKLVLDGNNLYIHPDYLYLSNEIILEFI